MIGETKNVIDKYLNRNKKSKNLLEQKWDDINKAPGNEKIKLLEASIRSIETKSGSSFTMDNQLLLNFCFYNLMEGENNLDIAFYLTNENRTLVFVDSTSFSKTMSFKKGKLFGNCIIPSNLLNEGIYTINRLILSKDKKQIIYEHKNVLIFNIVDSFEMKNGFKRYKEGVIRPKLKWNFYENN